MGEKNFHTYLYLVLVLLGTGILSGCISPAQKVPEKPLLLVTPEPAPVQNASPQAAFGSQTGMTTAHLDYGVTISYPVTWRKEETGTRVFRDYGRNVINIANVYSPDITPDRALAAAPNPDTSAYTLLSIDVEPAEVPDFERYFNLATLAVMDTYPSASITKRNVQLKISVTDTFPGYKSYELDFDTSDSRGKYIFTDAYGTVYIFAFRNPYPFSREVEDIYKSIIISPEG